MPDETGLWNFIYSWTDSTQGGSGSFKVEDTGLPGPLRVGRDNSWYFSDSRGRPFDWRGYSLHRYLQWKYGRGIFTDEGWDDLRDKIASQVASRGYNALMLRWPAITATEDGQGNPGNHFWQQAGEEVDFDRFYIPQWRQVEQTILLAGELGVYVFPFVALIDQYSDRPGGGQMDSYLRYMAARLGPYWNHFGYSPVWEYQDIMSHTQANEMMSMLQRDLQGLPIPPLLSIHDHSDESFADWLGFSMRQRQSRTVFDGNCRTCGQHGGVSALFENQPIVGSEDIWQYDDGAYGQPQTAEQVRRGAWGLMMAGVMPVYLEDTSPDNLFNSSGEGEIRRLYDFIYGKTHYREYQILNDWVSKTDGQIAAGIPGQEYLVYDEDGGNLRIDINRLSSKLSFSVEWFDPKNGGFLAAQSLPGGDIYDLKSPFDGDSVLLLKASP